MATFETREQLVEAYKQQNPQFANWGPRTLYSTLYRAEPAIAAEVSGISDPYYKNPSELISAFREANGLADAEEPVVLARLEAAAPGVLGAWGLSETPQLGPSGEEPVDEAEEVARDEFARAFPNWIGRRPEKPLEEYRNGGRLKKLQQANLSGEPQGFLASLVGRGGRDWLPFATDAMDNLDLAKVVGAARRLMTEESDENLSDDDLVDLNLYLGLAQRESEGGWRSMAGSAIRQSLVMMSEFGLWTAAMASGLFTGGSTTAATLGGTGGAVASKAGAAGLRKWVKSFVKDEVAEKIEKRLAGKLLTRGGKLVHRNSAFYVAKDAVQEGIEDGIAKAVGGTGGRALAGKVAGKVAGQVVNIAPAAIMAAGTQALEGLVSKGVTGEFDTKRSRMEQLDQILSGEDSSPDKKLALAMLDETIEDFTEFMGEDLMRGLGGLLGLPGRIPAGAGATVGSLAASRWADIGRKIGVAAEAKAGKGVAAAAKQRLARGWVMLAAASRAGSLSQAAERLKEVGYHGFFQEYLEERLGGFLRGLTGIEGEKDENAMKRAFGNLFPATSDEAIAEAIALAVPMAGVAVLQETGNIASGHRRLYNSYQFMFRNLLGPEAVERQQEAGPVNLKEMKSEEGQRALDYGGRAATETDSQARTAIKTGLVEKYNFREDQGTVANIANKVLERVFGIRWLSESRAPDGRRGFHKNVAELMAANDSVDLIAVGDQQMDRILETKEGLKEDWVRVRNAQPVERGGDAAAWARRAELIDTAADIVSGQLMTEVRNYSSLVSLVRFFSEPELAQFTTRHGVELTPERRAALEKADKDVYDSLVNGDLDGFVHRDPATRRLFLLDAKAREFNEDQRLMLLARGIHSDAFDLSDMAADMAEAGAGPLDVGRLAAIETELAKNPEANKTRLEAVRRVREAVSRLAGGEELLSGVDLAELDNPNTKSYVAKVVRSAMNPDIADPDFLERMIEMGYPLTAEGTEAYLADMRAFSNVVRAQMSGTMYGVGSRVVHAGARPGEARPLLVTAIVPGPNGTTAVRARYVDDLEGPEISGEPSKFRNAVPLRRLVMLPGNALNFVGTLDQMESAGINPPTPGSLESIKPVKTVKVKGPKGEVEAPAYQISVKAFNTGDTLFVTTPRYHAPEDILEAAFKREVGGSLADKVVKIGDYFVLKSMVDAAKRVRESLAAKSAAAKEDGTELTKSEQALLKALPENMDADEAGNTLFEMQQKLELLSNLRWGESDVRSTLRPETEEFAGLVDKLVPGFRAGLHGVFSGLVGRNTLQRLAYRQQAPSVPVSAQPAGQRPVAPAPPVRGAESAPATTPATPVAPAAAPAQPAESEESAKGLPAWKQLMISNLTKELVDQEAKLAAAQAEVLRLAKEPDSPETVLARKRAEADFAAAQRQVDETRFALETASTSTVLPQDEPQPDTRTISPNKGSSGDDSVARLAASMRMFVRFAVTRPAFRGMEGRLNEPEVKEALARALTDHSGLLFRNAEGLAPGDYARVRKALDGDFTLDPDDVDDTTDGERSGIDDEVDERGKPGQEQSTEARELSTLEELPELIVEAVRNEMFSGETATATEAAKQMVEFADLALGTWGDGDLALKVLGDQGGTTLDEKREKAALAWAMRSPLWNEAAWEAFKKQKITDPVGKAFHEFLSLFSYEDALALAPRMLTRSFVQVVQIDASGTVEFTGQPNKPKVMKLWGASKTELNSIRNAERFKWRDALSAYFRGVAARGPAEVERLAKRLRAIVGSSSGVSLNLILFKQVSSRKEFYREFVAGLRNGGRLTPRLPDAPWVLNRDMTGKPFKAEDGTDFVTSGERSLRGLLDLLDDAFETVHGDPLRGIWKKYSLAQREALLRGSQELRTAIAEAGKHKDDPNWAARVGNRVFEEYYSLMADAARSAGYFLQEVLRVAEQSLAENLTPEQTADALARSVASRSRSSGAAQSQASYLDLVADHVASEAKRTSVRFGNGSTQPAYQRNSPLIRLVSTTLSEFAPRAEGRAGQTPLAMVVLSQDDVEVKLPGYLKANLNTREGYEPTSESEDAVDRPKKRVVYPGDSSAELEYRAAVAVNNYVAESQTGDFFYPVPLADKNVTYYFLMDRGTVLREMKRRIEAGEALNPKLGTDLISVMDGLALPKLVMSGYLGEAQAKDIIESGKYGKRVRVLSTPGDLFPIVEGGVPVRYDGFVATKFTLKTKAGDEELVEPFNGAQFYDDDMARRLNVSRGLPGSRPFVKAMDYISNMIKAMSHHITPWAGAADSSGIFKAVKQLMADAKVSSFTDTGAAKIYKPGKLETYEVEIPKLGGTLVVEGHRISRWGAHLFETTNMVRPTAPQSKINTISIAFNLSQTSPEQRELALLYHQLQEKFVNLVVPGQDELVRLGLRLAEKLKDPDLVRIFKNGKSVRDPMISGVVAQMLLSRLRRVLTPRSEQLSMVLAPAEPTAKVRGAARDLMVATPLRDERGYVPGLMRLNINSRRARYGLKLKPGAVLARVEAALHAWLTAKSAEERNAAVSQVASLTEYGVPGMKLVGTENIRDLFPNPAEPKVYASAVHAINGETWIGGSLFIGTRIPGGPHGVANGLYRLSTPVTLKQADGRSLPGDENLTMQDGTSVWRRGEDFDADVFYAKQVMDAIDAPIDFQRIDSLIAQAGQGESVEEQKARLDSAPSAEARDAEIRATAKAAVEAGPQAGEESYWLAKDLLREITEFEKIGNQSGLLPEVEEERPRTRRDRLQKRFLFSTSREGRRAYAARELEFAMVMVHAKTLATMTQDQLSADVNKTVGDRVVVPSVGARPAMTVADFMKRKAKPGPAYEIRKALRQTATEGLGLRGMLVAVMDAVAVYDLHDGLARKRGETEDTRHARADLVRRTLVGFANMSFDVTAEDRLSAYNITRTTVPMLVAHLLTDTTIDPSVETKHSGDPKMAGTIAHSLQRWTNVAYTNEMAAIQTAFETDDFDSFSVDFNRMSAHVAAVAAAIGRYRKADWSQSRADALLQLRRVGLSVMRTGRLAKKWSKGFKSQEDFKKTSYDLYMMGKQAYGKRAIYGLAAILRDSPLIKATRKALAVAGAALDTLRPRTYEMDFPSVIRQAFEPELKPFSGREADLGRELLTQAVYRLAPTHEFARLFQLKTSRVSKQPGMYMVSIPRNLPTDFLKAASEFWRDAATDTLVTLSGETTEVPANAAVPLIAAYLAAEFGPTPSRYRGSVYSLLPETVFERVGRFVESSPAREKAAKEAGEARTKDAEEAAKKDAAAERGGPAAKALTLQDLITAMPKDVGERMLRAVVSMPADIARETLSEELSPARLEEELLTARRTAADLQESALLEEDMNRISEELRLRVSPETPTARVAVPETTQAATSPATPPPAAPRDLGTEGLGDLGTKPNTSTTIPQAFQRARGAVLTQNRGGYPAWNAEFPGGFDAFFRATAAEMQAMLAEGRLEDLYRRLNGAHVRSMGEPAYGALSSQIYDMVGRLGPASAERWDGLIAAGRAARPLPPVEPPAPVQQIPQPRQGELDFRQPNTSSVVPYVTQRQRTNEALAKHVPLDLFDGDPVLQASLEGFRQAYAADASALDAGLLAKFGDVDGAKAAIDASQLDERTKILAKQGVDLAVDTAVQGHLDAQAPETEFSPDRGVSTSTVSSDQTMQDSLRYYAAIGGAKRAHHILKKTTYFINAEEQRAARFMLREMSVWFEDPAMTRMVRMFPSKEAGKRDFARRFRDKRNPGWSRYEFTEQERNLLMRVILAERALREGTDYVIYGGKGAWVVRNGKNVFDPVVATQTDQAGVPQGHLESADAILKEFESSALYQKYLEFGRTKEDLDVRAMAKRVAGMYRQFRENVNKNASFVLGAQDYLNNQDLYAVHTFGRPGFPTAKRRDAERMVEMESRAGSRSGIKAKEKYSLPSEVFSTAAGKKRVEPPPALRSLFQRLSEELDLLRDPTGAEQHTDRRLKKAETYDIREMNQAVLSMALQVEAEKAEAAGGAYKMDPAVSDLIRGLRNTIQNYAAREYTGRTQERKYPTLLDAYQDTRGFLVPRQQDPFTQYVQYVRDVTAAMRRQTLTSLFMLTPGSDGLPLVIAVPNLEEQDRRDENTRLVHDDTIKQQVTWLVEALGLDTPAGTPNQQLAEIIKSGKLDTAGYVEQASPFDSFSKFLVAKRADRLFRHVVGETPKILIELGGAEVDLVRPLMDATQFMKHMAVSWSLFFGVAGLESVVAGTGLKNNVLLRLRSAMKSGMAIHRQLNRGDPVLDDELYQMHLAGLDISERTISDTSTSVVDRLILSLKAKVAEVHGDAVAETVEKYARFVTGRWLSEALMGKFFPTLKVWAAKDLVRLTHERMPELTREQVLRAVAPNVNAAYGGQSWDNYEWATPNAVTMINLGFFAGQWTNAALNVAGAGKLTGHFMENYLTPEGERFVFTQNWPAMYLIALQLIPNMIQAGIWATSKLTGSGDDDDKLLAVQNELGKGGFFPSIDITPLVRSLPGYTGDKTGKRRIYVQFGKQSYEVIDGWLKNAKNQLLRKTSMPIKLVWEQVFGSSPGSPDFTLPFVGKGLAGWWTSSKGFFGSRAGIILQKFLPLTASSLIQNRQAWLVAPFVPASKGMNETKAIEHMSNILRAYAEGESFRQLKGDNALRANLRSLTADYIDALERNGYDADMVLTRARGSVLPWYYADFFKAFQDKDEAGVERAARKIARLGGTSSSIAASFTNRRKAANQPAMTPEEQQAVEDAFEGVLPDIERFRQ